MFNNFKEVWNHPDNSKFTVFSITIFPIICSILIGISKGFFYMIISYVTCILVLIFIAKLFNDSIGGEDTYMELLKEYFTIFKP